MLKVLVVEDDPYVLSFYGRLFKKLRKYEVKLVKGGEEALRSVKDSKPDLMLLDILMPHVSGLTVLEKIKSDPETKDIMVIMLTNLDDDNVMKQALKLGAEAFILKTEASPELLLDKFAQNILSKKRKTNGPA
jgi:CheY-like chemotaxis protein